MEIEDLLGQLDDYTSGPPPTTSQDPPRVPVAVTPTTQVASPDPVIDIREHVQRAGSISDEILSSWRSDRTEAQVAANFIKGIIDGVVANGQTPGPGLLEHYISALNVKASTNATAVKCVDSIAKLIAATRSGTQIQNNTLIAGNHHDLIAALERPVNEGDP